MGEGLRLGLTDGFPSAVQPSAALSGFGAPCHASLALATPGLEDCETFSASTCISSSASIIAASGSCDHRRSCSYRAPSHVVRLQSMSLAWDSSFGIVFLLCTQLLNIRPILRSTGLGFLGPDLIITVNTTFM